MIDYSLESICAIFAQHAVQYDNDLVGVIASFKERFPEEELPKHLSDNFNIARAMGVIAEEVVKLKNK